MAKKYVFLVSYILDNQPQSTRVDVDAESLTPDQALFYLQSLHAGALPGLITDVQVSRVDTERTAFPPGHGRQP
ncbi:hypothetical protein [Pseudomonas sp. Gutcm_11s]|uniref:hypothetical protein n=1 Tax=Pseudomonas sp. Gutcm_11s TaxID=3026088 RepID=UPI00235ECCCA|nr:hypothetical protein [Pseudomonas sp. Gutcm_11s]MDD0843552.1 hypothetical protein [Pseudomonas sp. Gutcm_11s]